MNPPAWDNPPCQNNLALFFPTTKAECLDRYPKARALCNSCPHEAECLEWIMATEHADHRHGMWAGLTPGQRDRYAAGRSTVMHARPKLPPRECGLDDCTNLLHSSGLCRKHYDQRRWAEKVAA